MKHILNLLRFTSLTLALCGFSQMAQAHNDHAEIVQVDQTELSSTTSPAPERLGPSSFNLLSKDITIEGGYGKGWFYETPQNLEEELVNQGFAMLNMFQYADGFRSFNTALKLNPESLVAQIGRALNALNLDGNNTYYLEEAFNQVVDSATRGLLDAKMTAWSNMYLALVSGQDLSGQPIDVRQAYVQLKNADPTNLEVYTAINWIAGVNDLNDYDFVLQTDPNNAGALHYLMHIAESRNDHGLALSYGQKMVPLTPNSAHGQHMLGHVLPHFNRWAEADEQFEIAHKLHMDWAAKNGVTPDEDWHYGHNLMLLSVTKMVYQPELAINVLQEIQSLNPGAIIDTLDYLVATTDMSEASTVQNYLTQVEGFSPDYKNYVLSSRLYSELVFNSADADTVQRVVAQAAMMPNFKNKNFLQLATALIIADRAQNIAAKNQAYNRLISQLDANFSRGGFDGWQQSVIETLMYKKVFEVYNLQDGLSRIQTEIIDVYMNPNNPK
jgi:tetratricopeptide (TPR) repeat protein